jgi:hypothetical protein
MKYFILLAACISMNIAKVEANKPMPPVVLDLTQYGVPATITLPEGITAQVAKDGMDVLVKLSDGGVIALANTFEKRDVKVMLKEYKEQCKTIFDKVEYVNDEPDVVLYKADQMGSTRFGLTGYRKIKDKVYSFGQQTGPGISFSEAQCKMMLGIFKTLKAK